MTFELTTDLTSDQNTSGNEGRGSLPKFNHLYPILFFTQFIRFCGANKCGRPLTTNDGKIESITTLEQSGACKMAEAETPTRAQVAAEVGTSTPRSQSRARGRSSRATLNSAHPEPPRPQDVSDAEFRAFNDELREKKRRPRRRNVVLKSLRRTLRWRPPS